MSIYNAIINRAIYDFSLMTVFEMVIGFMIALLLDLLLVGPSPRRLHSACRSTRLKNLCHPCHVNLYGDWHGTLYVCVRFSDSGSSKWAERGQPLQCLSYDCVEKFHPGLSVAITDYGPISQRSFHEICKTKAHSRNLNRKGVSLTLTPFAHESNVKQARKASAAGSCHFFFWV